MDSLCSCPCRTFNLFVLTFFALAGTQPTVLRSSSSFLLLIALGSVFCPSTTCPLLVVIKLLLLLLHLFFLIHPTTRTVLLGLPLMTTTRRSWRGFRALAIQWFMGVESFTRLFSSISLSHSAEEKKWKMSLKWFNFWWGRENKNWFIN